MSPPVGGVGLVPRVAQSICCWSDSRLVVTATRGRAPWASGGRSVASACRQVSTRASHIRAPWSRGSTFSSQVSGSTAGAGLVSGSSAALIAAASSTVPRPRSRTPPAPSSVIDRNRPRWAARSWRSRSFSASRSACSGSATSTRCRAALARSVAFSRPAWSSRNASPRSRTPVSTGEPVDGVDDHRGLLGRDRPVGQRGVGGGPLADQGSGPGARCGGPRRGGCRPGG